MAKRSVLIIYTGGTIGMIRDLETGTYKPFDFAHMYAQIPELKLLDVQLQAVSMPQPIDSSNMHPGIWSDLLAIIESNYQKFDGFVILHGSDTMAHTASALSFMIRNLGKPVVLTGSQLPMGIIRTDGKENLITAIEIAAAHENGVPLVPEVCIYFEYKLYRGNRTHKYNAEQFLAFRSPNYPHLAEAGVHITFNKTAIMPLPKGAVEFRPKLDDRIFILKLFPGINEHFLKQVFALQNLRGLVLETFGSGNAPTASWFIDAIEAAVKSGIVIINVTQCNEGRVEQGRYETSTGLKRVGVIGGADLTSEAACAKLMFLLANRDSQKEIELDLGKSQRGEMTV
jgi:L-asparaginase